MPNWSEAELNHFLKQAPEFSSQFADSQPESRASTRAGRMRQNYAQAIASHAATSRPALVAIAQTHPLIAMLALCRNTDGMLHIQQVTPDRYQLIVSSDTTIALQIAPVPAYRFCVRGMHGKVIPLASIPETLIQLIREASTDAESEPS